MKRHQPSVKTSSHYLFARHKQHMHRQDLIIARGAGCMHRYDIQYRGAHDHYKSCDVIAPSDWQFCHTPDLRAVNLESLIRAAISGKCGGRSLRVGQSIPHARLCQAKGSVSGQAHLRIEGGGLVRCLGSGHSKCPLFPQETALCACVHRHRSRIILPPRVLCTFVRKYTLSRYSHNI